MIPDVSDEEQAEIKALFSPTDYPDSDFVNITNWFDDEEQAQ